MAVRINVLTAWLNQQLSAKITDIIPLQNDASFRRYFRVTSQGSSWIAMDAPPDKEDCRPFVAIATDLLQYGVTVPQVFATDLNQGFLLLTDFGDQLLLNVLRPESVGQFYRLAMAELVKLLDCHAVSNYVLPTFDEKLIGYELNVFVEWYLLNYLQISVSAPQQIILEDTFNFLIHIAKQQPQVFVHRDYHSRNLLLVNDNKIGMIDFQDAVQGPITYDLVSLLKDCYIAWPRNSINQWVLEYYELLLAKDKITCSYEQFLRWFDLVGLQRHLKVLGVFSRLHLRDGKSNYLNDMPRILAYVMDVLSLYPELSEFKDFIVTQVLPRTIRVTA